MLAKVLRTRTVARMAIVALALGLFALAGLHYVSTEKSTRVTAQLGKINEIDAHWGALFETLTLQDRAMNDFLSATDKTGQQGLKFAIRLGQSELDWLRTHTHGADREDVDLVARAYRSYHEMLTQMIGLGESGDRRRLTHRAAAAGLMADTLRAQLNKNIAHWRLVTTEYLEKVEQDNRNLQQASTVVFVVDVFLLLLCSVVLVNHQRRTERQAADSRHEAAHDTLTGLPNRALLGDRLEEAVQAVGPDDPAVALLLIDLDRFKEINDTLGHHIGDLLLRDVSTRLAGVLRPPDMIARLGGDEFAVLLPAIGTAEKAERVGKRLLHALQQPANLDGILVDVNASIGMALYPTHSVDAHQILQHADIAMYAAKRNQLGTAVYNETEDGNHGGQLKLLGELRRALDQGDLRLHYQPKIHIGTAQVCGVEALVRWQHSLKGLLLAEEFVPVAEQSGLITPLTQQVLTTALDQCHQWQGMGNHVPVSVNVATRCLLDPSFPAFVTNLLTDRHLAPDILTLQFPESTFLTDPPRVRQVLNELHGRGIQISIDDVGTGYSSAAYLRTLPVHELRTNATPIGNLDARAGDMTSLHTVVDIGHDLGLRVVAKGVHDQAIFTALRAIDCEAQGDWLCPALPVDDLEAWLVGRNMRGVRVF